MYSQWGKSLLNRRASNGRFVSLYSGSGSPLLSLKSVLHSWNLCIYMFFGVKNKRKKEIKKTWRKWSVYLEWEELCCSGPAMRTLSAILCAAILHAVMLTQSGKVVFRGNFLIKLTLASKKEETQKQAYSFSLLPAKT